MSTETAAMARIQRPLRDLAAWLAYFRAAPIPVLDATAIAVRELAANEDAVDAHWLAETVSGDPLMTLKLLAHVGSNSRRETDVETVVGALVLLGIGPFFRHFGELPTIGQALAALDDDAAVADAHAGLQAVLDRSYRAARFALGFAAHRMDPDAAVIHDAALLHGFAELLLWCHAPVLAIEIARRQQTDPTLRSSAAQQAVLGITLADLQHALMKAWRLPELLIRLDDTKHADTSQVKNVTLAVRLARHTALGWDNPALPDDVADIAALLLLGTEPTLTLLHQIDA
jgi:HD-like signal output (HDOD) protein